MNYIASLMELWWNDTDKQELKHTEENVSKYHSTIHPTWTGLRLKSGASDKRSETNSPNNGKAHHQLPNHPIVKLDTTCNFINNATLLNKFPRQHEM
jgi:hypothetical protein